jgi:hypothetical protein
MSACGNEIVSSALGKEFESGRRKAPEILDRNPVTSFFIMLFLAGCVSLTEILAWTLCVTGGVSAGLAVALLRH